MFEFLHFIQATALVAMAVVVAIIAIVITIIIYLHSYYFTYSSVEQQRINMDEALLEKLQHSNISIVGICGVGKSTLSGQLSQLMNHYHLELDGIFHGPNWTKNHETGEAFLNACIAKINANCEKVAKAGSNDTETTTTTTRHWITDGNYSAVRTELWKRSNVVIWLDYSKWTIFPRLLYRILKRSLLQEELWNGNRESLWTQFCTSDSLLVWAWNRFDSRLKEYEQELINKDSEEHKPYKHLTCIRLKSPAETKQWLAKLHQVLKKN